MSSDLPHVPDWLRDAVDDAIAWLDSEGKPITVESILFGRGEVGLTPFLSQGRLPDLLRIAAEVALLDRDA